MLARVIIFAAVAHTLALCGWADVIVVFAIKLGWFRRAASDDGAGTRAGDMSWTSLQRRPASITLRCSLASTPG